MRERVVAGAPFAAAVVGAVLLLMAVVIFVNSRGFGYDYVAYDAAARRIATGNALYVPGTAEAYARGAYQGLYLYPPPLAIALVPLTLVDEHSATLVWMAIRIALLVFGCAMLPVKGSVRLLTFAVACISYPILFDLNLGNVSIVVFALTALAWRLDGRLASAIVHAVLIAIRFPFGVFFALWLAQRRYTLLVAALVAGTGLVVLSLPIVGLGAYTDYVTILRSLPDFSTGEHNLSIGGTAGELGFTGPSLAVVTLAGYAFGLAAIVYAGLRRDRHVAFVMTAVATLVVSPFIHPHYLVLLLLPAALLAERGHWWGLLLPLTGWLPDSVLPFVAPVCLILLALIRERSPTPLSSAPSPAVPAA
jgi:glycosyl transferase family 87